MSSMDYHVSVSMAKIIKILLLVASSLSSLGIHGQLDSAGFISIDCGNTAERNYQDDKTGLTYVSDEDFVDTGLVHTVSKANMQPDLAKRYLTLRSFPNGTRNCYILRSLTPGGKYYVRAAFGYGNYDALNTLPKFDLYLGVNYWTTVSIINSSTAYLFEVIAVSPVNYLHVCLVNIGSGTPFISGLDLRSLQENLYPDSNATQSLVLLSFFRETVGFGPNRYHFGTDYHHIRYPDDRYDRIWQKYEDVSTWTVVPDAINGIIKNTPNDTYAAPSAVMLSVSTPINASRMDLSWSLDSSMNVDADTKYFVVLYFAEVEPLQENEFREFDVLLDNAPLVNAFRPEQMLTSVLTGIVKAGSGSHGISLVATSNSKPPLISAMEIYLIRPVNGYATDSGDANAMMTIQTKFSIKRNWAGDPCSPLALAWDGLNCTYNTSGPSRITALYLSSSGLNGEIDPSFGQLTLLQHLDLSHNTLSGQIPDFLGQLQSLTFLDLSRNNLIGPVPSNLLRKSQDGLLTLRIDNNPNLCANQTCNPVPNHKKNIVTIVASVLSGIAAIGLLALLATFAIRRIKKNKKVQVPESGCDSLRAQPVCNDQGPQPVCNGQEAQPVGDDQGNQIAWNDQEPEPVRNGQGAEPMMATAPQLQSFSYEELVIITDNFSEKIGEGGFGPVFSGTLEDGTPVAVKMRSQISEQGDQEFLAEVRNLAIGRHKNVVSLFGYCKDQNHLGLVYEKMIGGNLEHRLKAVVMEFSLTWLQRLKIALDSARGLDYLHSAFRTPLIHRDVKTRNILLTESLEAKISDFGLARALSSESITHNTTNLAGTHGYLDPEYERKRRLSDKSDVYSFGVVLLVLITGKKAIITEDISGQRIKIVDWVRQRLSQGGGILGVVDERIRRNVELVSVRTVLQLALQCAQREVAPRPKMAQVVVTLIECLQLAKANATPLAAYEQAIDVNEFRNREGRSTVYYSSVPVHDQ